VTRLPWITVAAVFALMTLGNVVSATGSGLACPDWPLCHGRLLPPLRPDVLLEYGHRLAALGAAGLLGATVVATLRRRPPPAVRRVALALVALLAVQVLLGGLTVLLKLSRVASTAHLGIALLLLAGVLALCRLGAPPAPPATARLRRRAGVTVGVLFVQLVLGGYVRHAGAGLACPDFPLCSGDVLPGHPLAVLHWTHRWLGVLLLGALLHLAAAARRQPQAGQGAAIAALGVLQVALGIGTVLLGLDPAVRALHAAAGYGLWALTVWLALGAGAGRGLGLAPVPLGSRPAHAA
jgi:heme A synthase